MVKKEILIGIIVGFVANLAGLVLAIIFLHENPSIIEVILKSFDEGILSKLISLGAIMNLFVFLVFIKKKQDYRARGVLIITIIMINQYFVFCIIFYFIIKAISMQKMQCEFSVRHRSQYGLHCTVFECHDVRTSYVTTLLQNCKYPCQEELSCCCS